MPAFHSLSLTSSVSVMYTMLARASHVRRYYITTWTCIRGSSSSHLACTLMSATYETHLTQLLHITCCSQNTLCKARLYTTRVLSMSVCLCRPLYTPTHSSSVLLSPSPLLSQHVRYLRIPPYAATSRNAPVQRRRFAKRPYIHHVCIPCLSVYPNLCTRLLIPPQYRRLVRAILCIHSLHYRMHCHVRLRRYFT